MPMVAARPKSLAMRDVMTGRNSGNTDISSCNLGLKLQASIPLHWLPILPQHRARPKVQPSMLARANQAKVSDTLARRSDLDGLPILD
jgi:hypothetical protein